MLTPVDDPTLGAMSQGRGHEIDDSGPLAELVRGSFEEAVEWSTIQRKLFHEKHESQPTQVEIQLAQNKA